MADYQVNQDLNLPIPKLYSELLDPKMSHLLNFDFPEDPPNAINVMVPSSPMYTRIPVPFKYDFKQHPAIQKATTAGDPGAAAIARGTQRDRSEFLVVQVPFSQKEVPQAPPVDLPTTPSDLVERIKALFDERPVWTRLAVVNRLNINPLKDVNSTDFRNALAKSAYMFTNGPWRSCYVRYGYDPRISSQDRMYQILDYRTIGMVGATAERSVIIGTTQLFIIVDRGLARPPSAISLVLSIRIVH